MTVLVSDSFNRANNTATLGTTDSYAGGTSKPWQTTSVSYKYGINNNQAYEVSATSGDQDGDWAYVDVGVSDFIYTLTVASFNDWLRIPFRGLDATHFLAIQTNYPGQAYRIISLNGTAETQLGASTTNSVAGDILKITCQGSTIKLNVNGVDILTVTSTFNQTSTRVGFSFLGRPYRADNFIVEDLNTGGTPTTQDGTASIIGTGTLASTGRILKNGSTSLVGIGTLSATATKVQNALTSMVGTGTLTATPVTIKNGQTSLAGQGLLVANANTQTGVVIVDGNASLLGNGLFGAAVTTIIQGNASLSGQGTFAINGIREAFGAVSFIGNGLFNVDLREITIVTGEVELIGYGLLVASGRGPTWEDAPYLAVPMYAVVQATEKNWKEVIQEKVKF